MFAQFNPHHWPFGETSCPKDTEKIHLFPEKYAAFILTDQGKEILRSIHYNILSKSDVAGPIAWARPPIRALIQDDEIGGGDLSSLISEWKAYLFSIYGDRFKINNLKKVKKHEVAGCESQGNYLWFNASAMCEALSKMLKMLNRDNFSARVDFYQIGRPIKLSIQNRLIAEGFPIGFVCCVYILDEAGREAFWPYNSLWPSSKEKGGEIPIGGYGEACRKIMHSGARWIFFSGVIKKKNFFHVLYPVLRECKVTRCDDSVCNQEWVLKDFKPPTFAFYISPDVVCRPFGIFDHAEFNPFDENQKKSFRWLVRGTEANKKKEINKDEQRTLTSHVKTVVERLISGEFDDATR